MGTIFETTYFENHAPEMLSRAGLTKAKLAESLGVAPQNIKKVIETKNVKTLIKVAEALGVTLDVLLYGNEKEATRITGYIEVGGIIHKIQSKEDIERILSWL
jgi:transcriptional regulator with XRE-family HTH domain